MFGTVEKQAAVVKELQTYPCCQRCILRYLGSRIPSNFKENCPTEIINKILHQKSTGNTVLSNNELSCLESPCETSTNNILNNDEELIEVEESNAQTKTQQIDRLCISCLGTLQDEYSTLFVTKIVEAVREADHRFESFQLSISLSSQFILRQHVIWKHLQTCHGSVYGSHKLDELCSIKDVLKWVYGPKLSSCFDVRFSPMSQFEVAVSINHAETRSECDFLNPSNFKSNEPPSKRRKKCQNYDGVPRTVVHKKLLEMSAEELERKYPWPPTAPMEACTLTVVTTYAPIFVAGRYNKYSRTLSQTPWLIDGERKTPHSVEEYICIPIKEELKAKDYKFSSSGREDVDVRTLGRGRPFLVELLDSHRALQGQQEMTKLQEVINSRTEDVAVKDLQIVTKEETKMLKEGEMAKTKSYKAKIWVEEAKTQEDLKVLETFKDLIIHQKTPIRVLHRRNLATRERVIHSMQAEYIDDHHFALNLCTQAGTYIKEFVHSDFGRTEPNLGSLLKCHVDILELDVASVDLDWPKKLENTTNNQTD